MLLQYIVVFIILDYVNGDKTKGSLTFVIDDTWSMYDDIKQVKEKTDQVFDAVLNSNTSKIEDFIIVTFNDPGEKLCTVTKDRDVFKKALAEIKVDPGGDCSEYAMKGIEVALEKSKPNSFFYVFTEAGAKDYKEYDRIKILALKKSIQVTFLVTGECGNIPGEANAVYDKLAAATNGQVCHIGKQDVRKIIEYIIASNRKHKKTTLVQKYFDNALKNICRFHIDSKVWDVIISVSGVNPTYHITDSDGNKVETKEFISTVSQKSHISKLEAKPGVYTVHLDSEGAISTVITGSTSVSFQHGFATVQPKTLNETSTKPVSGLHYYVSIALDNFDKDVLLDTIEIRDIDDNLISEFPLTLIDKNQQFYVTESLLMPYSTFKLAVNGHTEKKEKITRVASTTIKPQKPILEAPTLKAPTVTILEGAKIIAEYDKSMTLKCKVNAFPKPDVIWQDNIETFYSSEIVPLDRPYEYMSILKIDKVNKNVTIHCKAVNLMGENSEHITIETKLNYFIEVIAFPKDTTLEYGAPAELNFKVKAFPQVKITWYINGKQIQNNTDYEVSSDGLRIRQMRQGLKGNYTVEAYNEDERKKHHFNIDISGVIPVIDKNISDYKAERGSNMNISCRILKSKPSPVISWTFKQEGFENSIPLKEVTETLHLKNVGLKQNGTYTCLAHNEFGRDSHVVDLFVEYPPIIEKVETQVKIPEGDLVNLHCKVDGSPLPIVRWLFKEVEINNTEKYIYNNNSLSFTGSIEDNGIFSCEAINSLGKAVKDFNVTIFIIPVIDKSISNYKAERGSNMNISCRILKSKPSPVISWTFKQEGFENSIPLKEVTETLHLKNVGPKQNGTYTCLAHNEFGRDSHVVDLFVEYPPIIEKVETQVKIPEGDLVNLHCKVDGSPLPIVRWLFKEVEINNTEKYINNNNSLSFTGSIKDNGIFSCEAINSLGKAVKDFNVTIFIIPVIDKSISDYKAERGFNMNISCRILKSKPSPVISWTFKQEGFENSKPLKEVTETLHLKNVGLKQNGTYTCLAHNEFGRDSHVVDLFVEYPPIIEKVETQVKIPEGDLVNLHCKVDGSPLPIVRWIFKEVEINNTEKYIYNNNSLSFTGSIKDNGIFSCEAINSLGKAVKDFNVTIFIIPVIDKNIRDYKAERGSNMNISCRILKSKPSPVISWTFKQEGFENSIPLKEVTETLHLKNVGLKQIGTYTCLAHNEFGRDSHVVDLFLEYAPTIEKVKTQVKILKGQPVILTCKVDGSPFPIVRWLFNKVEINNTGKYIFNANSLSFTGSIEDNGIFTCEASNSLGKAEKHFYVTTFIPIKMTIPKQSNLKLDVGVSVELECLAEGYPKPKVQWIFYSKKSNIPSKFLRADSDGTLSVEHIQVEDEGLYRCCASNVVGFKSITYEIHIRAPVSILANRLGATTYDAVKGDLALRIPCNVIGSPKPVVTWETDGYNIASGTDWYDIEEDGTLIIKYPNLYSAGSYTCRASNDFSTDIKEFTVNVTPYPQLDYVTATLNLEIGTSHQVKCDLPHRYGDNVNWFKDGQFITTDELYLRNLTIQDSGVYSCRVSTFMSAHTLHKEVIVGCKPIFITRENTNIDLIEGTFAYLDCSAYGEPKPQIIWKYNGNFVKTSDMDISYRFKIKPDVIGSYECVVSNKFGSINRTFYIKNTKECLLDIEKDFNKHQPLLLSRSRQWPDFEKINNFVRIPKSTHLLLSCPGNNVTYNEEEFGENVKAICIENLIFKVRDRNVDFSKLKCKEEIKSLAKSTNQSCFSGNTDLLHVGFSLKRNFLRVYDVCIDKHNKIPLFTRHNLHQGMSGILPKENIKFTGSKYLPFNFEDMYNCWYQLYLINLMTGNNLSSVNECCFKKRQLVSPADVIPGLSQVATYNYLNVIPQWSNCSTKNWDEIELRIQSLVNLFDMKLVVFTGSSYPLIFPGQVSAVFLSDRFERLQPIPMYIWKVVQNNYDKSSLAIIQLNVPKITLTEALSYVRCKDICDEVEWMKNYHWHDVDKGFTFCCSITEFTSYYGTLIKGHDKVFKTIPLASDHSLI